MATTFGVAQALNGGNPNPPLPFNDFLIMFFFVAPLVGFLVSVSATFKAKINSRRRQEELRLALEREALQKNIKFTITELQNNSNRAVEIFNDLPSDLALGEQAAETAVKDYQNHAYSPFWSQIELGYYYLNLYKSHIEEIQFLGHSYLRNIERLREFGISEPMPPFPIDLDLDEVSGVLEKAATHLSDMTYEAQREATFAVIWEQRRNTKELQIGFTNLGSAVRDMVATLRESFHNLGNQLSDIAGVVEATSKNNFNQNEILIRQNAQFLEATRHQISEQRKQNVELREISRGAHFIEWGEHKFP